jgi:GNAT superfamily N-acetyltransferase
MSDAPATDDLPRWRAMAASDLNAVHRISMDVHPAHPERAEVLAEKFRLYPAGCFVLERRDGVVGYCFSHPWTDGQPPPLDTLMGALPAHVSTYFVHDLTVDESVRGTGMGRALVPNLFAAARAAGVDRLVLVAVNNRGPFWQAAGFLVTPDEAMQQAARAKYGAGAVHMSMRLGHSR